MHSISKTLVKSTPVFILLNRDTKCIILFCFNRSVILFLKINNVDINRRLSFNFLDFIRSSICNDTWREIIHPARRHAINYDQEINPLPSLCTIITAKCNRSLFSSICHGDFRCGPRERRGRQNKILQLCFYFISHRECSTTCSANSLRQEEHILELRAEVAMLLRLQRMTSSRDVRYISATLSAFCRDVIHWCRSSLDSRRPALVSRWELLVLMQRHLSEVGSLCLSVCLSVCVM